MKSNRENMIEALKKLKLSFAEVNKAWEQLDNEDFDILNNNYPFDNSFDEKTSQVIDWTWEAIEAIQKKSVEETP